MRLIGMIVSAALGIAVIAEGAYIVRTRSQLASLSEKLDSLGTGAGSDELRRGSAGSPRAFADDGDSDDPLPRNEPRGRALPRFVPAPGLPAAETNHDDPLPLPAAITTPEAREQLRQFILAQLERERQERRAKDDERRQQRNLERVQRTATALGLSPSETEKFTQLALQADTARAALRDKIEAGQMDRGQIRQEFSALRAEQDKNMRTLLGDDRMQKLDQIRRDQGPPDGAWGGRGFRGGGPAGGGPPGGGAPSGSLRAQGGGPASAQP
jgi:hypothetical protein